MFYFSAVLACALVRLGSGVSLCPLDQLALPVPAEFCDNSKCLPLSQAELENLGNEDYKTCIWTKGDSNFVGNCPINFNWAFSPTTGKPNMTITYRSGQNCNDEMTAVRCYSAELDPATDEYKVFKFTQNDSQWEFCYPFFIAGGFNGARYCRQSPYSQTGFEGFMYIMEPANGNFQIDKIDAYLKNAHVNISWEKIAVEC